MWQTAGSERAVADDEDPGTCGNQWFGRLDQQPVQSLSFLRERSVHRVECQAPYTSRAPLGGHLTANERAELPD